MTMNRRQLQEREDLLRERHEKQVASVSPEAAAVAASAPPLSEEHKERLRSLLLPYAAL